MKIVINKCFGGFGISRECAEYMEKNGDLQAKAELDEWRIEQAALDYFKENKRWPADRTPESVRYLEINAKYEKWEADFNGYGYVEGFDNGYDRTNPILVGAVEKLKKKASGQFAKLEVVIIPDGVDYYIDEYDGIESIHEQHRSW